MRLFDNLPPNKLEQDSVLTIGSFDGVHRGHQHIIEQMRREASRSDRLTALLTFHPHPAAVLFPDNPPKYLTTPDQKAAILEQLGLDVLVILPFDEEMANTTARDFLGRISEPLRVRELWVGGDFTLGRGREGNVSNLGELGKSYGFDLRVVPPFVWDGEAVSSTRIRKLLSDGQVEEAGRLLNRYHSLAGEVVPGAGRGRRHGIPTANLQVRSDKAVPMDGVYAVWATAGDGRHMAVANIGSRPSFHDDERAIEVHILDFERDIYGCQVLVEFVKWLRPGRPFSDVKDLYVQVDQDIADAKTDLAAAPVYPEPLLANPCASLGNPVEGHRRFSELEHTADTGVEAHGHDLGELFSNAAYGMFSLIGDLDGLFHTTRYEVEVNAADRESLLVEWLGELLYLHESKHEIFITFDITHISDKHLQAVVYGTHLAQVELEIKAVTYHDLRISETPQGYEATVVFDV